jgi:hypothetical protein
VTSLMWWLESSKLTLLLILLFNRFSVILTLLTSTASTTVLLLFCCCTSFKLGSLKSLDRLQCLSQLTLLVQKLQRQAWDGFSLFRVSLRSILLQTRTRAAMGVLSITINQKGFIITRGNLTLVESCRSLNTCSKVRYTL